MKTRLLSEFDREFSADVGKGERGRMPFRVSVLMNEYNFDNTFECLRHTGQFGEDALSLPSVDVDRGGFRSARRLAASSSSFAVLFFEWSFSADLAGEQSGHYGTANQSSVSWNGFGTLEEGWQEIRPSRPQNLFSLFSQYNIRRGSLRGGRDQAHPNLFSRCFRNKEATPNVPGKMGNFR